MGGELGPHHDAKSAAALRDQVLGIYRTPRECKGSEKRHARRCQALGRGPHTQGPRRSLRSGHRVRVGGPGHDHPSGLPRPDRATPRRGAARTGRMDGHGHYGPRDSACAGAHAAAVRDLHYPCLGALPSATTRSVVVVSRAVMALAAHDDWFDRPAWALWLARGPSSLRSGAFHSWARACGCGRQGWSLDRCRFRQRYQISARRVMVCKLHSCRRDCGACLALVACGNVRFFDDGSRCAALRGG
jgi:hypothetical protein